MSLVQLGELIEDNRASLVRAGIRGIDLDYLLDIRVEHKPCEAQLASVVQVELARWLEVRNAISEEQWAYFQVTEERNKETMALRKATRDLHDAFKKRVLVYHKEAERRSSEARKKPKAPPERDAYLDGILNRGNDEQ